MVGLVVISLGTGGIKPCVAAFGGDQFQESQVKSPPSDCLMVQVVLWFLLVHVDGYAQKILLSVLLLH